MTGSRGLIVELDEFDLFSFAALYHPGVVSSVLVILSDLEGCLMGYASRIYYPSVHIVDLQDDFFPVLITGYR
jgi:hypothetical protein